MPKPFPYEDSHHVPWKYDVSLISTRTRKEEVCSNISSGLSRLIRSGHCYTSEELKKRRKEIGKGIAEPVRNRVMTEEANEFLKVIRNSKYNVIQQLNKSLAQTSILALLLSSKVHHNALLKVLKETRVPTSATKSAFEGMVSTMLATNQISFTDDELPPEGRDHALPMHIIIKCEDMIVAAGAVGHSRKVDSPYNMLLGRPWLHTAGTVSSTLHRRLKFPSKDLMVTIMAEEPLTFFKETFVPYIGANAFLEATFHSFELISRASKLESAWPFATLMATKEMLKFGYQLGQGLGVVGHGKTSLVELPDNKGGFGLGYDPSNEELFQASKGKKRKCIGQGMSIPHIRVTFSAPAEVIRSEVAQESYEEKSNLACLIRLCPEEFSVNAIISPGDDLTTTIRPYVPSEIVGHWTVEPYFVVALVE